jgi:quinol monooxygenase YgiN
MYGVVRQYQADPNALQDLVQRIRGVVPELQQIQGFVSYDVVVSGSTLISISIYGDKAGADESTELARRYVQERWSDLKVNPPQITEGDIPLHATP